MPYFIFLAADRRRQRSRSISPLHICELLSFYVNSVVSHMPGKLLPLWHQEVLIVHDMNDVLDVELSHRVTARFLIYLGAVDDQMERALLRREQEVWLSLARELPRARCHGLNAACRVYFDAVTEFQSALSDLVSMVRIYLIKLGHVEDGVDALYLRHGLDEAVRVDPMPFHRSVVELLLLIVDDAISHLL